MMFIAMLRNIEIVFVSILERDKNVAIMNVFLGHDGIGLRVKRSFRIGIAHPVSLQKDYLISSLYIYIYIYIDA